MAFNEHKLDSEKVKEIRRLRVEDKLTVLDIAKKFGVNKSTVSKVLLNETYYDPEYEKYLWEKKGYLK